VREIRLREGKRWRYRNSLTPTLSQRERGLGLWERRGFHQD
jgi:hypothetical protein